MSDLLLVDTHCHIYLDDFREDLEAMMERASAAGVARMFMPALNRAHQDDLLALARKYPGRCLPMTGLHPCYVDGRFREELDFVARSAATGTYVAIGEIGLDYHWDLQHVREQQEAFREQLKLARDLGLPVVIHSRKSTEDCIRMVSELQDGRLRGIFHCFSGSLEQARAALETGFYLGIGGVVTFRNGGLEPIVSEMPLDRLVLETDAPYLAPVPYRGKRNEPAFLALIARAIAEIRKIGPDELARITSANADSLFGARNREG